MIIFGSILTTFELSIIFGVSWGSIENWLEPKTIVKFCYAKSVKRSVRYADAYVTANIFGRCDQGSISSMFHEQLLHPQIPKAQKNNQVSCVVLCFWDLQA